MGLWDLITEDEKQPEESVEKVKEAEVVEEQPTEPQEQAIEQATAAQTQQEAGVDAKDASEEKQATPKKKKPAEKKESTKEVNKSQSLEEQIATVPNNLKTPIDKIFKHLMSIPGMDMKMRNPEKSITDMWQFIEENARKQATGNMACVEDEVVYGWAVHYYDEDDPR